jgi:uncharacterized protein YndB with AHSA1/START domain
MATAVRSTRSSRVIKASPDALYAAFTDPEALTEWLPPGNMAGRMHAFEHKVGGGYRMSLFYPADERVMRGKTKSHEDQLEVRFVVLEPGHRIVETVRFFSADAAFHGEMTITVTFAEVEGGTEVAMLFENLPEGVTLADNEEGARLSLEQLAKRFE